LSCYVKDIDAALSGGPKVDAGFVDVEAESEVVNVMLRRTCFSAEQKSGR
jgi:hypothetical protein